jgi:prolipoprotein diacylglyceryltransferase
LVSTKKLVTATLFGVLIGVVYGALPFEIGDSLIVFEAIILSLSFILLGPGGATYTGFINGVVETPLQLSFGPFAFGVALFYGVLVDVFSILFSVRSEGKVNTKRLVASLSVSTIITGAVATYAFIAFVSGTTAPFVDIYLPILIVGALSGTIGGFIASRIWERNLKPMFQSDTAVPGQSSTG